MLEVDALVGRADLTLIIRDSYKNIGLFSVSFEMSSSVCPSRQKTIMHRGGRIHGIRQFVCMSWFKNSISQQALRN